VVKATGADMPDFAYKWNETNVDIVVDESKNKNKEVIREQRISELTYFVTHMNMKFLNEQTVAKLYDAGYDNIVKILELTKADLMKLDNFKETMTDKIYESIQKSIEEVNILTLATASNLFGHSFGGKRLKKIFENYPKVFVWIKNKSRDDIVKALKELEGFEDTLAGMFADNIGEFEKLVMKLPKNIQNKVIEYNWSNGINRSDFEALSELPPLTVSLLHCKNQEYEYPNEGNLVSALETFQTVLQWDD
jgi:hypothetical protein